jgi:hypothetical protein
MALEGMTPADLAGIKVQGDNRWLTLIQNDLKLTGRMVGHQFFLEGWNGQKSI